jgi:1-phosphofructokinase family hexose kinase
MKNPVLTVTLNPAVDKTIKISNFKLGREHRFDGIFLSAGGQGVNVSQALKKLGVYSVATGFAGGVSGSYIRGKLNKEKIKTAFIEIQGETRSSLTVIDRKNRKTTRILENGPLVKQKEVRAFKQKFSSLLDHCCYVVFSGRNIPGTGDSFYRELIRMAKKKGKITVLDTSGAAFALGIKAKPDIIKPNLREAEIVLKRTMDTTSKIKKGMRVFLNKGIKYVIVSLGSHGAIGYNGEEFWSAVPPAQKAINPVGSGDALVAGFISAQLKEYSFAKSLQAAVAVGTANALSINPGYFTKAQVRRIIKKVKLKKV